MAWRSPPTSATGPCIRATWPRASWAPWSRIRRRTMSSGASTSRPWSANGRTGGPSTGLPAMPERLYGVRHHGPGSARAVVQELERQHPDVLLVEGPPEADSLVGWVADAGLQPPVALLGYAADD